MAPEPSQQHAKKCVRGREACRHWLPAVIAEMSKRKKSDDVPHEDLEKIMTKVYLFYRVSRRPGAAGGAQRAPPPPTSLNVSLVFGNASLVGVYPTFGFRLLTLDTEEA